MNFKNFVFVFNGLLILSPVCRTQSTYNYGGLESDKLSSAAVSAPIRSLTATYPSATTGTAVFPTAPTAFGGVTASAAAAPPGSFSGFPTTPQGQRTITPISPSAAVKRPSTLPQRPTPPTAGSPGLYGQFGVTSAVRSLATATGSTAPNDSEGDYSAIPGVPGIDYPLFSQVPQTNFDCAQQALPGYYADIEAQCQVFHICALNRTYSFLCPNGTIFSQEVLVCVWWNQYDCASAPSLYANNAFIYDYGTERIPTNAGYQGGAPTQIGRGQSNLLSNTGRTSGSSSGIFGANSLRANLPGANNIAIQPNALSTIPSAVGRFNPSVVGNAPSQTYPGATASTYGGILRSANAAVGSAGASSTATAGYGGAIQEPAYSNARVATPTSNREYLPPRRT
uniref:Chitin-binding type-2 domain-containing protein n=1 Tax=Glossina brevipalpis TaxID=37001 RepID=A0A1A9WL77_9MUSC